MEPNRRTAWQAAGTRAASCRTRQAALQAGYKVTAADLARASQRLAVATERAERARLAQRERHARRLRRLALVGLSAETVPLSGLPSAQLTAGEFAAWLRARGARLVDVAVHYLTIGGACSPFELDAFLNNALDLPDAERAVLRHALWELDEFRGTI